MQERTASANPWPHLLIALVVIAASLTVGGEATEALPDLSGSWVMLQVTTDIVEYPLVGQRTRVNVLVLRLQIDQSGTSLTIREAHCVADLDDGTELVRTEITEAFLRSLSTEGRSAELQRADTGWHFVFPWGTEVHGARLEDPVNDPLPSGPEDPRVFDQDGDGNPGVTVRLSILGLVSGEVYAVQRLSKHLKGDVVSDDHLVGLIDWSNEQVRLAATDAFLMTGGDAEVHPDPERSYFIARRIHPELTCAELRESWRELLGL